MFILKIPTVRRYLGISRRFCSIPRNMWFGVSTAFFPQDVKLPKMDIFAALCTNPVPGI